jgi:hypothetical protein
MEEKNYKCYNCGRVVRSNQVGTIMCCGHAMVEMELDKCTNPGNPEAYRFNNDDDACDDGRAGT